MIQNRGLCPFGHVDVRPDLGPRSAL